MIVFLLMKSLLVGKYGLAQRWKIVKSVLFEEQFRVRIAWAAGTRQVIHNFFKMKESACFKSTISLFIIFFIIKYFFTFVCKYPGLSHSSYHKHNFQLHFILCMEFVISSDQHWLFSAFTISLADFCVKLREFKYLSLYSTQFMKQLQAVCVTSESRFL